MHGVNNYVWPASHRANTNAPGPPLGARMRLKPSTNISGYPPYMQKIFRAMKTYGLIVADTGSDMFVSGVFDPRWSNDQSESGLPRDQGQRFRVRPARMAREHRAVHDARRSCRVHGQWQRPLASFNWVAPTSGGALTDYLLEAGSTPGAANLATVPVPASATSFAASAAAVRTTCGCGRRNTCGSAASNEVMVTLSTSCRCLACRDKPRPR